LSDDVRKAKNKALETTILQIEKQFGKGSIFKLGGERKLQIDTISTGSLRLNEAIGIGGVPRGRIIEIFGHESGGKTTVALHILAECQKAGGIGAFIDAEHAIALDYAKNLGVDISNLILSQPSTGEEGLEITEALVRSGAVDVIVVDSVTALVPKAEIEGEMGDSHVGRHARLMSQALRKLAGVVNKSNTVVIFINQLREKVGVTFGSPETTTGGRSLKYYSSVRLDVRKVETLKKNNEFYGNRVRIKVVKNKVAPPFKNCEVDILYGSGIDIYRDIVEMAVEKNIIEKTGSWYRYNGDSIGQGYDNARQFLIDNPITAQVILESITGEINSISMKEERERLKKIG
jgi:recombination protein RecA